MGRVFGAKLKAAEVDGVPIQIDSSLALRFHEVFKEARNLSTERRVLCGREDEAAG